MYLNKHKIDRHIYIPGVATKLSERVQFKLDISGRLLKKSGLSIYEYILKLLTHNYHPELRLVPAGTFLALVALGYSSLTKISRIKYPNIN